MEALRSKFRRNKKNQFMSYARGYDDDDDDI